MKLWLSRHWLFVVMVAAPTLGAIVYYGLIASDVYVSESRFLVRSSQQQGPSGVVGELLQSSVLGGLGGGHTEDDTSAVHDYILSRDALKELDGKLDLRKVFSNPDIDLFDRFPVFSWSRSFEKFFLYYGKRVDVESDSASSISILTVRAFTAEDAYQINRTLLGISERLVNTLNDRSRHDLIDFADHEVKIASDKAKDAAIALFTYRSGQAVFAPDKQAIAQLETVGKVQQELISTETELAQLKKLSPDNPQIGGLTGRTEALRKAIASEASKVTSDRGSFSARAPNFERLSLDVEFADKQLGTALAELESARADALQKQVYLDVLVQPNLPDKALQPRRFRSIFAFLVFSLVAWAVASIIIASVREHAD
jgi:capsular polysaccharide transport system permease protein